MGYTWWGGGGVCFKNVLRAVDKGMIEECKIEKWNPTNIKELL
jgi:hypothetical protein